MSWIKENFCILCGKEIKSRKHEISHQHRKELEKLCYYTIMDECNGTDAIYDESSLRKKKLIKKNLFKSIGISCMIGEIDLEDPDNNYYPDKIRNILLFCNIFDKKHEKLVKSELNK